MPLGDRTRVVMVHPFFPENIGAAARAMKHCGLHRLVLVGGCRADHPNAIKLAVESREILENVEYAEDLAEALQGVDLAFASSSNGYDKRPMNPREASSLAFSSPGELALVFGNEKNGLTKAEVRQCHQLIQIPSAYEGGSLNLSQALMLCSYEWMMAEPLDGISPLEMASPEVLERVQLNLTGYLEQSGFYKPHHAQRNRAMLGRILTRLRLDVDEAEILRRLVSKLDWYFRQGGKK